MERGKLEEVLENRFTTVEKWILLNVPPRIKDKTIAQMAKGLGIGVPAIKARYANLVYRLRRYLKSGEYDRYKSMVNGKKS